MRSDCQQNRSKRALEQRSPAQRPDGDEGLTGGRVQPDRLHQTEVEEAQSEPAAHVRQVVLTQQDPGHAHQEGPQVEQDPQGDLQDESGSGLQEPEPLV